MGWGGDNSRETASEGASTSVSSCDNCGAPEDPGLVACSYCDVAYPGAPPGVDCPTCGDDNRPHRMACASCGETLLQGCLFCGAASSLAVAACGRCGEAFDGARERKAGRDAAQKQQQMMGLAGQGLSVLGQAASSTSGRGILNQVWQEILSSSMKK
ncbi:MAG: bL32 family ribosomal protein [Sandaracinaceae bacterium]